MRRTTILLLFCYATATLLKAQTMHSILFTNMQEKGRENDRRAELQKMTNFCTSIAAALDYKHDLRIHSGNEFTSTMMEREISSLNVGEGDIVILYYAGHGCNWDDDNWPHMALLDKQYWESTAYSKLKAACTNAKLTLCIASCCNMDSEGQKKVNRNYAAIDKNKAKELFLGFEGKKSIIASSSIRGQFSYSWSSGATLGSIYTISLRKTIEDALSGASNIPLTWEGIFEGTKKQTLAYTNGKQLPQYKIEENKNRNIAATPATPKKQNNTGYASVENVWVKHNQMHNGIKCMEIHAKIITHHMNTDGGRLVALFESPRGTALKDTNGSYRTTEGQVSVGNDFGSHNEHASFSDITLIIPNSEIHSGNAGNTYCFYVGVYDYKQKKYVKLSDYHTFSLSR